MSVRYVARVVRPSDLELGDVLGRDQLKRRVALSSRIAAVGGPGLAVPDNATIVDGSTLQVYPGFIDGGSTVANSDLGLSDAGEQGLIKPDLQAATALKPDSPLIGLAR